MNARRLLFALACVVIGVTVLVWQFPARGLLPFLPATALNTPLHRIHELEGTLWRGAVTFSTVATPALQRAAWQCAPAVTSLAIDCALTGAVEGRVIARPFSSSATLEKVALRTAVQFAPNAAFTVSGESLVVLIDSGEVSRNAVSLKASAALKDARITSPALTPPNASLGEVFVECAPDASKNASTCTVKNRASANRIDGTLQITPSRVSGKIDYTIANSAPQKISF